MVAVAAVAVAAAGVSAGVAAAEVTVVAAEVIVEVPGVTAGDHQVVVPPEAAVLGVSGIQAAGLQLPEAMVEAAARAALIVEAGRDP